MIPHLGGGGAERVVAQLAQHLDPQRFAIHLCVITADAPGAQPPPPWVQVHRLERKRVRQAWPEIIRLVRAVDPDVILSGMAHLNFLLLLLKPLLPRRMRLLVRQNTTASSAAQTRLARLPYRHLYPRAHRVLCQSEAMATDLAENFNVPRGKLTVLANPIDVAAIRAAGAASDDGWPSNAWPRMLSIGRLASEKGIDLLLHAISEVRKEYPQIHIQILGAGPEEAALRKLSAKLQLETAVSFAGHRKNLNDYFNAATLFVLPSRYEGMPNALLEAAAADLPIVATPCSAGLSELLRNAPGTWLASAISAKSLAESIHCALSTLEPFPESPQRFEHAFLAPFETSTAVAAYAALIESIAAEVRP